MTPSPDAAAAPTGGARARVDSHERRQLSDGWQAASASPGEHSDASGIDALAWAPAEVPGTAAGALARAGSWKLGDEHDFDAQDWWFRTSFDARPEAAHERVYLRLEGVATVAQVYLNGELVLESDSMFAVHELHVGPRLRERNELAIRCRALRPLLAERRRPRQRWRTRLVGDGNLRFFRTMLLGRCPGAAPGPAVVGPWRPVLLERRASVDVDELALRPRVEGQDGVLSVRVLARTLADARVDSAELELRGPPGAHATPLRVAPRIDKGATDGEVELTGELRVAGVERWWPHTHGQPHLYDACVRVKLGEQTVAIDAGRVGFRELAFGAGDEHELERDGPDVHVNGVRVFARGAVWTPIDPVGMAPPEEDLRAELARMRDAGMNMVRVPGVAAYETRAFHDLCDELGLLVWQDLMFANLDYPLADERFRASVEREARGVLAALGGRASTAIVCGNSEVEQQAAMMGVEASIARGELFGELLPALVRKSGLDCLYVPSAPCGGDMPFRPDRGVGTYYGVGAYRLPLADLRRAQVRFAAEALAFSHVPCAETIERMAVGAPTAQADDARAWKAGVPRDNGADWDFEDVRDHYLGELFGADAAELRRAEHERYLELSRVLTGELLAEAFGEWRRRESPCAGALVLWQRDLLPGAGWGLVDRHGVPKLAYRQLARVLAPVAVWTVDERLGGVVAHVANDRAQPLEASLRVALYSDRERLVEQALAPVRLDAHSQGRWSVEAVIGRFVDVSWTYRFGPPALDTIVVSLEQGEDERKRVLSQAMRFPTGWPLERESPRALGLHASASALEDARVRLTISSERLAYGVSIHAPGYAASDDGFSIEPRASRTVELRALDANASLRTASVSAVNMSGPVTIALG